MHNGFPSHLRISCRHCTHFTPKHFSTYFLRRTFSYNKIQYIYQNLEIQLWYTIFSGLYLYTFVHCLNGTFCSYFFLSPVSNPRSRIPLNFLSNYPRLIWNHSLAFLFLFDLNIFGRVEASYFGEEPSICICLVTRLSNDWFVVIR